METNWSLILNILLLLAVLFSIVRLVRRRRVSLQTANMVHTTIEDPRPMQDEIIAIRKINTDVPPVSLNINSASSAEIDIDEEVQIVSAASKPEPNPDYPETETKPKMLMMLLLARENRQFAGYELLQTILASGLRFGEGQLFHRHQFANGQGPILCSLAAATNSGLFDLQNIGAFSVRGLCLYMEASGNTRIDEERFTIMLDTARQLSEGLDALLLDDMRRPLTDQRINRYYQMLDLQNYV